MIFKEGQKFEETFVVTNNVYEDFIRIFKDKNPLHTDEGFAVSKGFKGRVMDCNILNGFLSYFIGECLPGKNVIIHSQEINFNNAVYLDDVLLFEAEVTGVYESFNTVQFKYNYKNAAAEVVAKGQIQIGIII